MYHYVGPLPPNADVYRRDLTVSPGLFEQTLTKLVDQGVETATMADLFEHFAGGQALPKRSVNPDVRRRLRQRVRARIPAAPKRIRWWARSS